MLRVNRLERSWELGGQPLHSLFFGEHCWLTLLPTGKAPGPQAGMSRLACLLCARPQLGTLGQQREWGALGRSPGCCWHCWVAMHIFYTWGSYSGEWLTAWSLSSWLQGPEPSPEELWLPLPSSLIMACV